MASTARMVLRFFTGLRRVQPGEGRKPGLMFGIMMCVVGTFIMGRIVRASLFLSRYAVDYLPFMYIWVALGVSVHEYIARPRPKVSYRRPTRRRERFDCTLLLFARASRDGGAPVLHLGFRPSGSPGSTEP